ncbi:MAG: hypothetical protein U0703_24370 [Anaerolineae bacterium]
MNVLMISLDTALWRLSLRAMRAVVTSPTPSAPVTLAIIVYTPPGIGGLFSPSSNLTIYPTNSRQKWNFPRRDPRGANRAAQTRKVDLIVTQDPFSTGLDGAHGCAAA